MNATCKYRGRLVTEAEVLSIRQLIAADATVGRCALSRRVCELWEWKQPNGALCDMLCRGLLLQLDRAGVIQLPPPRSLPARNPLADRRRPEPVVPDNRPVSGALHQLFPLEIVQVRRSPQEPLFNSLMEQYHYLGFQQPVGEHLKFLVQSRGQAIACMSWGSAPRHLGARDRFIGWDVASRRRNLHLIAYNSRFLILPWVRVAHLASHILGWMARHLSTAWERAYAHPIYLLETFVDPERFRGTCYRAANWMVVGKTTGRGKDAPNWTPNRSIKEVLVLPLEDGFRQLLRQ